MQNQKVYLLAELTVLPEFLDDLNASLRRFLFLPCKNPAAKHYSRPHGKAARASLSSLMSFRLRRRIGSILSRTTRSGF